jgi:hypothetical protein
LYQIGGYLAVPASVKPVGFFQYCRGTALRALVINEKACHSSKKKQEVKPVELFFSTGLT